MPNQFFETNQAKKKAKIGKFGLKKANLPTLHLIGRDNHVRSVQPSLSFSELCCRGVHRVGYKRSTRPDKVSNKPEHDPIPERRKPDDPNPTGQ